METVGDAVATGPSPEDAAIQQDRVARLLVAVERLQPREREIVTLKLAGGLSNVSIGRLCHLRPGHVAVIVHRSVRALCEMLVAQEDE